MDILAAIRREERKLEKQLSKLQHQLNGVLMDNVTLIRVVAGAIAVFVFLPLLIVPYWRIFSKAGFRGTLAFLMLVSVVNLIVLYYIAFSKWNVRADV
jgi:hypothetical protein